MIKIYIGELMNLELSKEKTYIINDNRTGRYELSTKDGKSHCFHMDDSFIYEYFPITSKIEELEGPNNV